MKWRLAEEVQLTDRTQDEGKHQLPGFRMDKDHADDGKICQGKAKDHGPFTAHTVGKQAHGNAQQER